MTQPNGQLPYRFPRLGQYVRLPNSSAANIYNSVRRALRTIYPADTIQVSCQAMYSNSKWQGTCIINGVSYIWEVY